MHDSSDPTLLGGPAPETTESDPECYIDQFRHSLPHRAAAQPRACGHRTCDPHTITYYGTGAENDAREGDYCIVCFERAFPGRCPDPLLRQALRQDDGQQSD